MNEHGYTRALTQHLPKERYKWKINDPYQGGVVDFFYEGEVRDAWIELKYLNKFPKKDQTLIDLTRPKYLSQLQQNWLIRRHHRRGDTLVIAGSPYGGVIYEGLDWQHPISALAFKNKCLNYQQLVNEIEKFTSFR